jgi:hypothetical protein
MNSCIVILVMALIPIFAVKDVLEQYVLNDIGTQISLLSRTNYDDTSPTPWQSYSSILAKINFPNVESYLNLSPNIEFGHFFNHTRSSSAPISRLTESYLGFSPNSFWHAWIGNRRLSFESGRFVSDASFNLLPRTFGQFGISNSTHTMSLIWLYHVTEPDTVNSHHYPNGSLIAAINDVPLLLNATLSTHIYLFDGISDTISHKITYKTDRHTIAATAAFQSSPSIKTVPVAKSSTRYCDIIYLAELDQQSLKIGTRFFESGPKNQPGFSSPYSSGHSWDGFTNSYQHDVRNGFKSHFQSIFSILQFEFKPDTQIQISGFWFRDHTQRKNYGGEINLGIQKEMIKNSMFWVYKLGQFFPGTHSNTPPEITMWLDLSLNLGNIK